MQVIEYATENDLLSIAGAATATEIIHAWEAGCDIVKVYPALFLGGPDYIRTLRGPIRDVAMLAGGPVPLDTIEKLSRCRLHRRQPRPSLAVPDLVKTEQWEEIGRRGIAGHVHRPVAQRDVEADSYVH